MKVVQAVLEFLGIPPPRDTVPATRKRDPMIDLVNTAHTQNEEIWNDINERRISRGETPLEPYRVSVQRLYGIDHER